MMGWMLDIDNSKYCCRCRRIQYISYIYTNIHDYVCRLSVSVIHPYLSYHHSTYHTHSLSLSLYYTLTTTTPPLLFSTPQSINQPQPQPQIGREYPLNLSILISGGKETNRDSLSNGERSGNSSNLKSKIPLLYEMGFRIVAFQLVVADIVFISSSPSPTSSSSSGNEHMKEMGTEFPGTGRHRG